MSDTAEVVISTDGALGRITLNRPRTLNALALSMCSIMQRQLDVWADDQDVSAVLIDAVPGRAFCAGGDIRAVSEWSRSGNPNAMAFFRTEYSLNATIKSFNKPYIALIDGIVMGGGVGVSVHGSHRVITENAVFAMPETAIGFFPDVGGSYFLPRCPGAIGMYLGLTGARLTPADMLYAGLATHAVSGLAASEIAPRLAAGEAVEAVLASLSVKLPPPQLAKERAQIDRVFCAPTMEAIVERLESEGNWGKSIAALLETRSPTSLKLTHRQLREGATRELTECLAQEFQIASHVLAGHDFHEGVRAVLIDKDNKPDWKPSCPSDVTDADIEVYFQPRVFPLFS